MEKLIVTIAPTGNVPTREKHPQAPLTVDEIVADIKNCVELGASIAHIHVRNEDLKPTSDRKVFKKVLKRIDDEKIDVIKQLSTGARGGENTFEWRGQMLDLDCHMASLATGSSNFAKMVNANSFELIEKLAVKMNDNGIKPELEIFDYSMMTNALWLEKKGVLKGPLHFNLVMGVPGSMPGTIRNLSFLVDSLPPGSTWTVSGIGSAQVPMITTAILLGGHVRTGIEDCLTYKKDVPATNSMLVERIVKIAGMLDRPIANVAEAKEILSIKK
ncbi:MAG: 3-keto-5-aminohexanoate cleavage protein [Spirochaetales bacterium]|nr:3-keto-5-aminohexanoate cleavage protein [Spirochaetales bacterium]